MKMGRRWSFQARDSSDRTEPDVASGGSQSLASAGGAEAQPLRDSTGQYRTVQGTGTALAGGVVRFGSGWRRLRLPALAVARAQAFK